jgi:hypothetical protein
LHSHTDCGNCLNPARRDGETTARNGDRMFVYRHNPSPQTARAGLPHSRDTAGELLPALRACSTPDKRATGKSKSGFRGPEFAHPAKLCDASHALRWAGATFRISPTNRNQENLAQAAARLGSSSHSHTKVAGHGRMCPTIHKHATAEAGPLFREGRERKCQSRPSQRRGTEGHST